MNHKTLVKVVIAIAILSLLDAALGAAQKSLPVRIDRWLAVRQLRGTVTYERGNTSRSAQSGDRLQSVGDGLTTSKSSTASIEIDTGIGVIEVAENTTMRIQSLELAPDNGRITRIQVINGQVRLKVRKFNHGGSRLEIQTPAGSSGVRGTEFGITVQPSGRTGLATRSGKVTSTGRGKTIFVNGGFQNITIPGEPPSQPVPLRDDPRLQYKLERLIENDIRRFRLVGQVDPVNRVIVAGNPVDTDRDGRFTSILLPVPSYPKIPVEVITPLGKKRVYELLPQ
jgi:hypothetical protein